MTVIDCIQIALDPKGKAIIELKEGQIFTKNDIVCLGVELNRLRDLAENEYERGYDRGFEEGRREAWPLHWHKMELEKAEDSEVK